MAVRNQELYCHGCGRYVQFQLDDEQDGQYVFECPNCGHEHCRFVEQGKITDQRWDSRNGVLPMYTTIASSTTSASTSSNYFTYSVWGTNSS